MIKVENLTHSFSNRVVLQNLDLGIKAGQLVGLYGPSGSGKTTLLRLLAGLEEACSGKIWLNGQLASSPKILIAPPRRQIALVFQDLALWPHMTAFAHLEFTLSAKTEIQNPKSQILNLLEQVQFPQQLIHHYPHQLSGGEKQRLALARALAQKPKILLLDEPLRNLDTHLKEVVKDQIIRLHQEQNLTTLWVSHDQGDFKEDFDRAIELSDLLGGE